MGKIFGYAHDFCNTMPPIIEKQRIIDSCERSAFQLIEQFVMRENNVPKAYRSTAKAHVNLF